MARDVLPHAMGNGHPAFFGWVNSPPALAGVPASLTAAAMNPSVVSGDHADVHVERTAVRWLAELVGYPHAPGAGLLTSGASAATIVCLAGARGRAAPPRGTTCAGSGSRTARASLPTCPPRRTAACRARSSCSGSERLHPAAAAARRASRRGRAARRDRGRPRSRRDARAARGLGGDREHGRDRPARCARRSRRRRAALVPRRRGLRRVRRARPGAGRALPGHGARRLADARPAQVARRPG